MQLHTGASRVGVLLLALTGVVALAQGGGPIVGIAEHRELGHHLVGPDGYSLYQSSLDEDGSSACYERCAQAWLPLLAGEDGAVAGEGVDEGQLGVVERNDGGEQVTYRGAPLYTFVADREPGDAMGHGFYGVWSVVDFAPEATSSADGDLQSLSDEGAGVYFQSCAGCHGRNGDQDGGGAAILVGHAPLENTSLVIRQVLYGSQYMPSFGSSLSDRDVAAVATFIRNSWGNSFGVVTEEEVVEVRKRFE